MPASAGVDTDPGTNNGSGSTQRGSDASRNFSARVAASRPQRRTVGRAAAQKRAAPSLVQRPALPVPSFISLPASEQAAVLNYVKQLEQLHRSGATINAHELGSNPMGIFLRRYPEIWADAEAIVKAEFEKSNRATQPADNICGLPPMIRVVVEGDTHPDLCAADQQLILKSREVQRNIWARNSKAGLEAGLALNNIILQHVLTHEPTSPAQVPPAQAEEGELVDDAEATDTVPATAAIDDAGLLLKLLRGSKGSPKHHEEFLLEVDQSAADALLRGKQSRRVSTSGGLRILVQLKPNPRSVVPVILEAVGRELSLSQLSEGIATVIRHIGGDPEYKIHPTPTTAVAEVHGHETTAARLRAQCGIQDIESGPSSRPRSVDKRTYRLDCTAHTATVLPDTIIWSIQLSDGQVVVDRISVKRPAGVDKSPSSPHEWRCSSSVHAVPPDVRPAAGAVAKEVVVSPQAQIGAGSKSKASASLSPKGKNKRRADVAAMAAAPNAPDSDGFTTVTGNHRADSKAQQQQAEYGRYSVLHGAPSGSRSSSADVGPRRQSSSSPPPKETRTTATTSEEVYSVDINEVLRASIASERARAAAAATEATQVQQAIAATRRQACDEPPVSHQRQSVTSPKSVTRGVSKGDAVTGPKAAAAAALEQQRDENMASRRDVFDAADQRGVEKALQSGPPHSKLNAQADSVITPRSDVADGLNASDGAEALQSMDDHHDHTSQSGVADGQSASDGPTAKRQAQSRGRSTSVPVVRATPQRPVRACSIKPSASTLTAPDPSARR